MTLQLTSPGQSAAKWLARNVATTESLARAREALGREDTNAVGIKAFALSLQGLTFDAFTNTKTLPMTDPDGRGSIARRSIRPRCPATTSVT